MYFNYFEMLTGDAIYVDGVGHLRSPRVSELKPTSGIGYAAYNIYLNFLSWDKEHLLKYVQMMQYRGVDKLKNPKLTTFDVVTLLPQTRELCRGVLSFFMLEELVWDEKKRRYLSTLSEETKELFCGEINRDNFEWVRGLMLQMNYIDLDMDNAPAATHTSERTRELWEQAQKALKKQSESSKQEDKPEYHLSNIISKICSVHPTYNILNIFDLTIFQLYDAFFQMSYMRGIYLNEQIFSNHGGDYYASMVAICTIVATIVCIYSDVYVFLIEMLGTPKAHTPKRSDEIGAGVTVTKVEKSCEMEQG